jgi:triacylglycerol lipase
LAQDGVKSPIVPAAFAAPTAGNQAFADYYTYTFLYCPGYCNEMNIAPDAWSNLDAVYSLCHHCGVDLPDDVLVGLDSMIGLMDVFNMSYAQR